MLQLVFYSNFTVRYHFFLIYLLASASVDWWSALKKKMVVLISGTTTTSSTYSRSRTTKFKPGGGPRKPHRFSKNQLAPASRLYYCVLLITCATVRHTCSAFRPGSFDSTNSARPGTRSSGEERDTETKKIDVVTPSASTPQVPGAGVAEDKNSIERPRARSNVISLSSEDVLAEDYRIGVEKNSQAEGRVPALAEVENTDLLHPVKFQQVLAQKAAVVESAREDQRQDQEQDQKVRNFSSASQQVQVEEAQRPRLVEEVEHQDQHSKLFYLSQQPQALLHQRGGGSSSSSSWQYTNQVQQPSTGGVILADSTTSRASAGPGGAAPRTKLVLGERGGMRKW